MLDQLIATPGVREELTLAGTIGVMALHGGIESGTAEAARRVAAATGASRYAIVQPDDQRWHLPSVAHDPRHSDRLRAFLEHITFAVSFHGFGRRGFEDAVLLGGRNRRVAAAIAERIARRATIPVVTGIEEMPRELRGMHPANPVNLPEFGGVQVEMSPGARSEPHLGAVVDAVAFVIRGEMASVCPAPEPPA